MGDQQSTTNNWNWGRTCRWSRYVSAVRSWFDDNIKTTDWSQQQQQIGKRFHFFCQQGLKKYSITKSSQILNKIAALSLIALFQTSADFGFFWGDKYFHARNKTRKLLPKKYFSKSTVLRHLDVNDVKNSAYSSGEKNLLCQKRAVVCWSSWFLTSMTVPREWTTLSFWGILIPWQKNPSNNFSKNWV